MHQSGFTRRQMRVGLARFSALYIADGSMLRILLKTLARPDFAIEFLRNKSPYGFESECKLNLSSTPRMILSENCARRVPYFFRLIFHSLSIRYVTTCGDLGTNKGWRAAEFRPRGVAPPYGSNSEFRHFRAGNISQISVTGSIWVDIR